MKAKDDVQMLIRMPKHLREKLEQDAEREYRTLTSQILYLIDYALAVKNEPKPEQGGVAQQRGV